MNLRTTIAVLALAAGLSACAEETPFGPPVTLSYDANRWLVSDRPDIGALQIVADTSLASGIGSAGMYRFEVDNLPQPVFAAAVRGWFLTQGRHCTATDGAAVGPKTYVFHYSCWIPTESVG